MMKKHSLKPMLLLLTLLMLLNGCGKKTVEPVYEFDTAILAQTIAERTSFKDELVKLNDERAAGLYAWGGDKITAYAGSGATAEVVIVVEYADEAAAQSGLTLMKSYIENQKIMYTDYNASEMPKLESALCETYGRFAVCVVSADNSVAEKVIVEQSTEG